MSKEPGTVHPDVKRGGGLEGAGDTGTSRGIYKINSVIVRVEIMTGERLEVPGDRLASKSYLQLRR